MVRVPLAPKQLAAKKNINRKEKKFTCPDCNDTIKGRSNVRDDTRSPRSLREQYNGHRRLHSTLTETRWPCGDCGHSYAKKVRCDHLRPR